MDNQGGDSNKPEMNGVAKVHAEPKANGDSLDEKHDDAPQHQREEEEEVDNVEEELKAALDAELVDKDNNLNGTATTAAGGGSDAGNEDAALYLSAEALQAHDQKHKEEVSTQAQPLLAQDNEEQEEEVKELNLKKDGSGFRSASGFRSSRAAAKGVRRELKKIDKQSDALESGVMATEINGIGLVHGSKESMVIFRDVIHQHLGMDAQHPTTLVNFGERLVAKKLHNGGFFLKHGRRGAPAVRVVWCSEDLHTLHWGDLKKGVKVPRNDIKVHDIQGVFPGFTSQRSPAWAKVDKDLEPFCFTLETSDRTLDLQCLSHQDRDIWVKSFQHLLRARSTDKQTLQRVAQHTTAPETTPPPPSDTKQDTADETAEADAAAKANGTAATGATDPHHMSREMLEHEVVVLREQLRQSMPRSTVTRLKERVTALQAEWLAHSKAEKAKLKAHIVKLRKQLKERPAAGDDFDDKQSIISDLTDISSVVAHSRRTSFFGGRMGDALSVGDMHMQSRRTDARLRTVEQLLRKTQAENKRRAQLFQASELKRRKVMEENNRLRTLVGYTISALAAPHDGIEALRTAAQFNREKEEAAGYLTRQFSRIKDQSVVDVNFEEMVQQAEMEMLEMRKSTVLAPSASMSGVNTGYGTPRVGGVMYGSHIGGLSISVLPSNASTVVGTPRGSQTPALDLTARRGSRQLGLVALNNRESKSDDQEVVVDPESQLGRDPASLTHTNVQLAALFTSLKAQWELANLVVIDEHQGGDAQRSGLPKWVKDRDAPNCTLCVRKFTVVRRRHHCRMCGGVFCGKCSSHRADIDKFRMKNVRSKEKNVRVCNTCFGVLRALESGVSPSAERLRQLEAGVARLHASQQAIAANAHQDQED